MPRKALAWILFMAVLFTTLPPVPSSYDVYGGDGQAALSARGQMQPTALPAWQIGAPAQTSPHKNAPEYPEAEARMAKGCGYPAALTQYMLSSREISFSGDDIVAQKAAELTAGKRTTEEKAMAIYNYIISNFQYDWALYHAVLSGHVRTYTPNPQSILRAQKGVCYDIASLFAAMARSAGIPAAMVKGNCEPANGYHAWNSIYDGETGVWVSLDATLDLGGDISLKYKEIGSGYFALEMI